MSFRLFLRSSTARLAASYLAIIMLMSVVFSIVFYNTSWHEIGRQLPSDAFGSENYENYLFNGGSLHDFFSQRVAEGRHELLIRLILLNLLVLVAGGLLSYYLARRTLEPIEANMEAQSQFVSDASHELRTPLTALQATNEVALRRSKISTTEAKEILRQNVAEVTKLKQLTDSLLRLAKPGGGLTDFKAVSLSDMVADAMNVVLPAAQQKHIAIDDAVPPLKVHGDRTALAQALVTILDNAVQYSPAHSTVRLSGAKQGKYALLTVSDQGMGISPEHLPHIFDRFYRADESRAKQAHDGYGIGLALAKKIITQHGGYLIAESTVGAGSTFSFKLPLAAFK